jgi:hypothetical protein
MTRSDSRGVVCCEVCKRPTVKTVALCEECVVDLRDAMPAYLARNLDDIDPSDTFDTQVHF